MPWLVPGWTATIADGSATAPAKHSRATDVAFFPPGVFVAPSSTESTRESCSDERGKDQVVSSEEALEDKATSYVVKNTFIEASEARTPSLDSLPTLRRVNSWPKSLRETLEGIDAPRPSAPLVGGRRVQEPLPEQPAAKPELPPHTADVTSISGLSSSQGEPAGDARSRVGSSSHAAAGSESRFSVGSDDPPSRAEAAGPTGACVEPRLFDPELPSRGSALHRWGVCKPCAFAGRGLCRDSVDCQFCHLCENGEKQRRRREWRRRQGDAQSRLRGQPGDVYAPRSKGRGGVGADGSAAAIGSARYPELNQEQTAQFLVMHHPVVWFPPQCAR